jgi:hypothetical protein
MLIAFLVGGDAMGLVVPMILILVFCFFWTYQFIQLMLFSDADFPGKHDKCLWTAAFIFALFLAPFAFFGWKYAYKAMLSSKVGRNGPSR